MRWPPHFRQYWRWLSLLFWKVAMCSAPAVTRTADGFHNVKAFTGAADHERQDWQWQYPMASGFPSTSSLTTPQKQLPEWTMFPRRVRWNGCARPKPLRQILGNGGVGISGGPRVARLSQVLRVLIAEMVPTRQIETSNRIDKQNC